MFRVKLIPRIIGGLKMTLTYTHTLRGLLRRPNPHTAMFQELEEPGEPAGTPHGGTQTGDQTPEL